VCIRQVSAHRNAVFDDVPYLIHVAPKPVLILLVAVKNIIPCGLFELLSRLARAIINSAHRINRH